MRVPSFGLMGALVGLGLVGMALLLWAFCKTLQIKVLQLAGKHVSARRVEHDADVAFRDLCGVPEPGEYWD